MIEALFVLQNQPYNTLFKDASNGPLLNIILTFGFTLSKLLNISSFLTIVQKYRNIILMIVNIF